MSAKLSCFCGFLGALMGVGHMTLKSCYWFLFVLMGLLHIEVRSPIPRGKGKGLPQSLRAFARVLRSTSPQGVCLDNLAFLDCVLTVLQVYLILGHVVLTCNFIWTESSELCYGSCTNWWPVGSASSKGQQERIPGTSDVIISHHSLNAEIWCSH